MVPQDFILSLSEIEFIETLPSLPDLNFSVVTSEDHNATLEFVRNYACRLRQISSLVLEIESKIDSDLDYHHLLNLLVALNNTKNILKSLKILRNDSLYKKVIEPTTEIVSTKVCAEDLNHQSEAYLNYYLSDRGSGLDTSKYS